MAEARKPLRGILPAPITPFAGDGSIQFDYLEKQLDYLVGAGVAGLFIGGTTAEGALLTDQERAELFRIARSHTGPGRLCCIVVLAADTYAVLRGIDAVADQEPDYIACVSPYYLGAGQREILGHYTFIADRSPAPVLLYNIPQNTGNPMDLQTILELAAHPNIAGIKDSSGNFMQFQRGLLARPADFTWIQGEDLLDAPSMLMGVSCIVTGLGNALIEPYVDMMAAAEDHNESGVLAAQSRINSLVGIIDAVGGKGLPAIKAAAASRGRATVHMRMPSMTLSEEESRRVAAIIAELGSRPSD